MSSTMEGHRALMVCEQDFRKRDLGSSLDQAIVLCYWPQYLILPVVILSLKRQNKRDQIEKPETNKIKLLPT